MGSSWARTVTTSSRFAVRKRARWLLFLINGYHPPQACPGGGETSAFLHIRFPLVPAEMASIRKYRRGGLQRVELQRDLIHLWVCLSKKPVVQSRHALRTPSVGAKLDWWRG